MILFKKVKIIISHMIVGTMCLDILDISGLIIVSDSVA